MPPLALDSVATLAPLARRLPDPAHLPRVPLTTLPTPVEPLERLAHASGIASLWIKRDDVSGTLYGGNKPRKLELLLGAARARGRRRVLTFGAIGTHHGLATAVCARAAGLDTTLVLVPQPVTPHVQRCLLLLHGCGAELHLANGVLDAARRALAILARGRLRGEPLELIPTGGTSSLGALGYVNAGLELAEQVRGGLLPEPAAIFVALGSGGRWRGWWRGCGSAVSRAASSECSSRTSCRRLLDGCCGWRARVSPGSTRPRAASSSPATISRSSVASSERATEPSPPKAKRLAAWPCSTRASRSTTPTPPSASPRSCTTARHPRCAAGRCSSGTPSAASSPPSFRRRPRACPPRSVASSELTRRRRRSRAPRGHAFSHGGCSEADFR